jgi:hypothetical protein
MKRPVSIAAVVVLFISFPAFPAVYVEYFEVDPSASWVVNNGPSDAAVNFFFDYSTVGIPISPNSPKSTDTHGMKIQANQVNGIFSGVSASPAGQSFTGDYRVEFDWWGNFNGPFPAGGSGSTQMSTFGVGTSGTRAQWPGGTQDSVWFAATVDGNSSADWRAYSTAAPTSYPDGSPIYAATGTNSRNSSNAYYASFGTNTAPPAQLLLYPQQTGVTLIGSAGMEWHRVLIDTIAGQTSWYVDDIRIATVDLSTVTLGGSNIFFGHSDTNATSSTDPNDEALLFTLIDNIRVSPIPEPGIIGIVGTAALALIGRRIRR